jgi:hypothetical protein
MADVGDYFDSILASGEKRQDGPMWRTARLRHGRPPQFHHNEKLKGCTTPDAGAYENFYWTGCAAAELEIAWRPARRSEP